MKSFTCSELVFLLFFHGMLQYCILWLSAVPSVPVNSTSSLGHITRRKIRLIESYDKCRYLKNWPVKGLLRQVFYLSEAPSPRVTLYSPPPYTGYTCIHYTYSGKGARANQREGGGAIVHKAGRKYQHDWLYLQSVNSKPVKTTFRIRCLYPSVFSLQ
jgi:hypothetical protein